jgi:hypothetical protein
MRAAGAKRPTRPARSTVVKTSLAALSIKVWARASSVNCASKGTTTEPARMTASAEAIHSGPSGANRATRAPGSSPADARSAASSRTVRARYP